MGSGCSTPGSIRVASLATGSNTLSPEQSKPASSSAQNGETVSLMNLENGTRQQHWFSQQLREKCPHIVSADVADQSALMEKRELPQVTDGCTRTTRHVLEEAEKLLAAFEWPHARRQKRMQQIKKEVQVHGTYTHTQEELELGARLAWRLAPRCISRAVSHSLQVLDCRAAKTPQDMFESIVRHLCECYSLGAISPLISVFPPKQMGQRGFRVWNHQLLGFAGWRLDDGTIIGDPNNIQLTSMCVGHGWKSPKPHNFCILPLLVEAPGYPPQVFELPQHVRYLVDIAHEEYAALEELELQWYAIPALSSLCLDLGGLYYSCAPFNGWYMGTEIARDLLDTQRYNLIPRLQSALQLPTRSSALHRDHVQLILNQAILQSFEKAGVTIQDHHSASDSFIRFMKHEVETRGYCPADWVWLVPPAGGSTTKVFHQEMINFFCTPCYRAQQPAWVGAPRQTAEASKRARYQWKRLRWTILSRRDTINHLREKRRLSKPTVTQAPICIAYGSETGVTSSLAMRLKSMLPPEACVHVVHMNDFALDAFQNAEEDPILVILTSTYGFGLPPTNAKSFLDTVHKHASALKKCRTRFVVFGVGSTKYPDTFCKFAHVVDQELGDKLRLVRLKPITTADVSNMYTFMLTAQQWIDSVLRLVSGRIHAMQITRLPSTATPVQEVRPITLLSREMLDETLMLLRFRCKTFQHRNIGDHIVLMPENSPENVRRAATKVCLPTGDGMLSQSPLQLDDLISLKPFPCIGLQALNAPEQDGLSEGVIPNNTPCLTLEMVLRKYAGDVRRWEWDVPRPLDEVLHQEPQTTGRTYTIASYHSNDEFDLLVTRVPGGFCSDLNLAKMPIKSTMFGSVRHKTDYCDIGGPVVVIGAGSGASLGFSFLHAWQKEHRFHHKQPTVRAYFGFRGLYSEKVEQHLSWAIANDVVRIAYSRHPRAPKQYVQDLLLAESSWLKMQLAHPKCCVFVCGSHAMESSVRAALEKVVESTVIASMKREARYVAEVYGA
eukprot:m.15126 g.15126  ORF g.15126 m.15126 type:complete len:1008 (-) comp6516_c0_seq2:324-3347(-)